MRIVGSLYLMMVLIVFCLMGGWVANIVKLVGLLHGDVTAMFIARVIGVFAVPLGGVLGFF